MKRSKLMFVALAAIILSLTGFSYNSEMLKNKGEKELYEIRTYEIKLGGDQQILIDYLKNVLQPTLKRVGANHFMLFNELMLPLTKGLTDIVNLIYPLSVERKR